MVWPRLRTARQQVRFLPGAPAILKSNLSFGRPEDRLNPVPAQSVKEGLPLGDGAALDGRSVLTPNLIELARCRRLDSFDLD